MANVPKDAVIPVSGIGLVKVPAGTDYADLHKAILDAAPIPQLTPEGAVENSQAFRDAAGKVWGETATHRGMEAGFTMDAAGNPTFEAPHYSNEQDGHDHLEQTVPENAVLALHTHNEYASPVPSQADIAAARKLGKPVMVASRTGLWEVDAAGRLHQVFKNTDWMDEKPMVYESLIQAKQIAKTTGKQVRAKVGNEVRLVNPDGTLEAE